MALIKSPLFDGLWGKIGDLEFRMRKNKKIELAKKRIPMDRKSEAQLKQRERYKNCLQQYYKLTPEQLKQYEEIGRKQKLDAFRAFMAECLKAPVGLTFDNDGGGTWNRYINIPLTAAPAEYAQYKIELNAYGVAIYSADGTLKTQGTGMTDFWNNVKTDGADIRAFDNNKNQLYFYIETFDYANQKAVILVRVEANITELNIAYGNPSATMSSYNNPYQTFEFFDDFNDLSNWRVVRIGGSGYAKVKDGSLKLYSTYTNTTVDAQVALQNVRIDAKVRVVRNTECLSIGVSDGLYASYGWLSNGYSYFWNGWPTETDRQRIVKLVNGTATFLATTANGFLQNNVEYILSVIYASPILKMLNDDIVILTTSDSTFASRSYLCLMVWGTSEYWVDWIRVLKLADPASFGTPAIITI